MTPAWRPPREKLTRLGPPMLIAGLVAWHAAYNWWWLRQNVVLTGWDKARHLAQSLAYNTLLAPLTLKSFFNAVISDTVRPPLGPLSAVVMYRLFGISGDVATMVNLVWMAITLVATWRIGVLLGGRRLGLLAVLLLALLPMFYAMSRYFYLEFPLMALVALTIWLLLASDGFRKRRTTLLFGLCLGFGLLTKRTYAAFVVAPVAMVLVRSGALSGLWQRLRSAPRVDLRDAALAVGGGLGLAALWVFPNWAVVRDLPLDGWLFAFWAGLVTMAIYLLRRRPAADANFLAAVALGATLGSLWYLPNATFFQRMLLFAYGVNDPRGRAIRLGNVGTYTDYLYVLVNQHLSLFVCLVLAGAGLALFLGLLRLRRLGAALRQVGIGWWVVVLWVVGPYLILSLSIYHEARAITPVLPATALVGGGLLLGLPWRRLATVLAIMLITGGIVQFYAVSFEPLHGLVEATSLQLPVVEEVGLVARGGYLQLPDSGVTDHRYWIEPDVLRRMEARRLAEGWDGASLGLLVNVKQVNFEHFAYLLQAEGYHPRITVERLARAHGEEPVYPRLYRNDFLLVKRVNAPADADSQEVIDRILDQPPELFDLAFELDHSYSLPDGDTVYLYSRRERPPSGATADSFPDLGRSLADMSGDDDAVVVMPSGLVALLAQALGGDRDTYRLPEQGPPEVVLRQVAGDHDRIFAVVGEGGADLDKEAVEWLNEHTYRAWDGWFGPTQLIVYGAPSASEVPVVHSLAADLGGIVTLVSYSLQEEQVAAGDMAHLTLSWQVPGEMGDSYKVFVHLVDGEDQLVAQRDSEPVGGSRPTATWAAGEVITDRIGLLLPGSLPPGDYRLLVGMYDPATSERLPELNARGEVVGDSISLGLLRVAAPSP